METEINGDGRQLAGMRGGLSVALVVMGILLSWLWQDMGALQSKADTALALPNPATSAHLHEIERRLDTIEAILRDVCRRLDRMGR